MVFGTGNGAKRYTRYLPENEHIVSYLDNSVGKGKTKFMGSSVVSPARINELSYDVIKIASSSFYAEMREQLYKLGIPQDKIESVDGEILHLYEDRGISWFCVIYYSLITVVFVFLIYLLFSF